ncbi:transcription elongation regulator 1-like, partial [Pollicipes pollicipes]|uniref:transcription elongation regulator 1-like n=1 Tax=Pollicipes pollicipes TaxID=41117 RepID=UPI0018850BC5
FRGRPGPPGPPWSPRGPWRGPPPPPFFRGPRPPFRGPPPFDPNWGPHPGMMGGPMGPYPPPPGMGMGPPPGWGGPMGPPGGPPPFQGPPPQHAPPPQFGGMNLANVWVETKNDDGKPYYYNAQSRETTWTKPEGDGVRILTQQEVEQMTQSVGGQAGGAAAAAGQHNRVKSESDAEGDNSQDSDNKADSSAAAAEGAAGGGAPPVVPGGPPPFGSAPPGPFNMPPPSWMGGPWGGGGGPPGPGGWAPGTGPPPTSTQMPPPTQPVIQGAPSVDNKELDPELVARAAEWTEHTAPDGRKYYYNAKSQQSVWVKPQPIADLEAARLAAQQQVAAAAAAAVAAGDVKAEPLEVKPQLQAQSQPPPAAATDDRESADDGMDVDDDEDSRSASETKEEPAPAKQEDKSRPVSSTPVPGSPWCVVWTGDGRVFFYNPSSRTSVWERPEELAGRADVDKMLLPPKQEPAEAKEETGEPPSKKAKPDEPKKEVKEEPPKKIDVGKEAAIEAEVRAARERAIVPLEIRMKQFRDMLAEKEVSAFSTWEKELHKIVFDPRYLLLTSRERKQVFDKYVKERAEEERREKRNKMRQSKEEFKKLLQESDLSGKTSFSEFAQKYGKEERFRGVEKMRERESLFNEHLLEIRRKEKEERAAKREQVKKDFFTMLREDKLVNHHAHWSDVKKRLDSDARYRAVESSGQREDWFRDHVHDLKEERRREKRREKEKKRKRASRSRSKERRSKSGDGHRENGERNSQEPADAAERAPREDGEKTDEDSDEEEERKKKETEEREKRERVEASLREREKEVQRTLAEHLRDRDKEREQHKHAEAVQHMLAVLADLVRTTDITWREAKRLLKKDHRWQLMDSLEKDEKEKLFEQHIEQLSKKKKEKFRELLDELNVELASSWKDVKKQMKDDPRYSKFSSSDRKCEREYREYLKDKMVVAKSDFRELLKETKIITHESLKKITDNDQHMKDILEVLRKDKRYLQLDQIAEEREQMIVAYLEDLDKRGPPPPPTASEPSRRLVK